MRAKLRFSVGELVLFLLVFVVGWAAWYAFRAVEEIDQTPVALERVRLEYLEIANHLQTFIDDSHAALEDVAVENNRAAWPRFEQSVSSFRQWLDGRKDQMTGGKVVMVHPIGYVVDLGSFLRSIRESADAYVTVASQVMTPSGVSAKAKQIEESAEAKSKALTEMMTRARSEAGAIELFSTGSRRWFSWVRRVILACILTLVVVATWLTVLVYRRAVVPLRMELNATQAIMERQQKLAHFGELAAIVAHEIRNPLTAIRARLFTLERALAAGSAEHADATMIGSEINRLNRIVQDFLESARPSNPQLLPMTASSLLSRVHKLLAANCEKQSIQLTVDENGEFLFMGDIHQLSQVLINLIQNATESIGEKGEVRLRARGVQRQLKDGLAEAVMIEVEDSGPGIPPAVQRRLFDPFFSTKKGGTGLGLSIAARIVSRHGGTIEFSSEPGRRTSFAIVLPLHKPGVA